MNRAPTCIPAHPNVSIFMVVSFVHSPSSCNERPTVGAGWRVSSVVLWARCPGLREVLIEHWLDPTRIKGDDDDEEEEGYPGGLDIAVDADSHVLDSIMQVRCDEV